MVNIKRLKINRIRNSDNISGAGYYDKPNEYRKLKPHKVIENQSLAPKDGWRIEIHVSNSRLSHDDCLRIIDAYAGAAGNEGQISIRKPSRKFDNRMLPWAVDNLDGEGVIFMEQLF